MPDGRQETQRPPDGPPAEVSGPIAVANDPHSEVIDWTGFPATNRLEYAGCVAPPADDNFRFFLPPQTSISRDVYCLKRYFPATFDCPKNFPVSTVTLLSLRRFTTEAISVAPVASLVGRACHSCRGFTVTLLSARPGLRLLGEKLPG